MAPFHIPWSTFGAFFLLAAAIVLAFAWTWRDRRREKREERR